MTPRNYQTRASFLSENPEDGELNWNDAKRRAAYVIGQGDNECLVIKSSVFLPEAIIAKLATLPESGPGYHKVKLTFKDGSTYSGKASSVEFETDGDEIEQQDPKNIIDVQLDD